jgi:hypothetical protein
MMRARLLATVLAAGVAVAGVALAPSASGNVRHDVHAARHATKHDRTPGQAKKHGYTTLVRDKNEIACIAMPGMGAMGVHYLNGARLDGKIRLRQPEALVYRFGNNGHLRLAALEYLVLRADWEKVHGKNAPRPRLFGHRFNRTLAGNRFGLPEYYSLHAWLWKHNPAGRFTMWNPRVYCPPGI